MVTKYKNTSGSFLYQHTNTKRILGNVYYWIPYCKETWNGTSAGHDCDRANDKEFGSLYPTKYKK